MCVRECVRTHVSERERESARPRERARASASKSEGESENLRTATAADLGTRSPDLFADDAERERDRK